MNYATECLSHMDTMAQILTKMGCPGDAKLLSFLANDLVIARKYLLPPPDKLNIKVTAPALTFLKLPYPVCAFEYSIPMARDAGLEGLKVDTTKSTKRIALVYDCNRNFGPVPLYKASGMLPKEAAGILVASFYYVDELKMWCPATGAAYIDQHIIENSPYPMLLDNQHLHVQANVFPLLRESVQKNFGHLSQYDLRRVLLSDLADELGMAVRICLLLNARNLRQEKIIEAPVKLNKKRAQKGKPPFFDYHTLDLFVASSGIRLDRKRVNFGAVREAFKAMHYAQTLSTVTGHFKARKTGVYFWSEHERKTRVKPATE